jgi:hypothetical protein
MCTVACGATCKPGAQELDFPTILGWHVASPRLFHSSLALKGRVFSFVIQHLYSASTNTHCFFPTSHRILLHICYGLQHSNSVESQLNKTKNLNLNHYQQIDDLLRSCFDSL